MSVVLDAIEAKKRGRALDGEVLAEVVGGYTKGQVPDYQMAALLMAIRWQGMTFEETRSLTQVMVDSGPRYSFPDCADKHSTGGVGDKVSLVALPLVAACGVRVAKLSGRGLGSTGGTIDKLESVPGLRVNLSGEEFRRQVAEVGIVIGAAGEVAPADAAIYALRDITGTVDSLPLIASSIVSKKVATGAGHLLYDVKCGSGAFMATLVEARELADLLVRLSASFGVNASAVVTDMEVPLGRAVGNALELRESVDFLRGVPSTVPSPATSRSASSTPALPTSPALAETALDVATRIVALTGRSGETGRSGPTERSGPTGKNKPAERVRRALESGAAYDKLAEMVRAQGGDIDALADLPVSAHVVEVTSPEGGFVAHIDALGIARAATALGAGRERKDDGLDHGAGVELLVEVGDDVSAGRPVARLYGSKGVDRARVLVAAAFATSAGPVGVRPHVLAAL